MRLPPISRNFFAGIQQPAAATRLRMIPDLQRQQQYEIDGDDHGRHGQGEGQQQPPGLLPGTVLMLEEIHDPAPATF